MTLEGRIVYRAQLAKDDSEWWADMAVAQPLPTIREFADRLAKFKLVGTYRVYLDDGECAAVIVAPETTWAWKVERV